MTKFFYIYLLYFPYIFFELLLYISCLFSFYRVFFLECQIVIAMLYLKIYIFNILIFISFYCSYFKSFYIKSSWDILESFWETFKIIHLFILFIRIFIWVLTLRHIVNVWFNAFIYWMKHLELHFIYCMKGNINKCLLLLFFIQKGSMERL